MKGNRDRVADEELMCAYAKGDAAAFRVLFERHRAPLFNYLLHHTGSSALAEDLFQEVFLRVIRARERYRPSAPFQAWLFTIARNAIVDSRRRVAVRREVLASQRGVRGEGQRAEHQQSMDADEHPLRAAERSQLLGRLGDALLELPEEQREVFLLRQLAQMDFKSIARMTKSRVATAKSRMRYAIENLRRLLAEELAEVTGGSDE